MAEIDKNNNSFVSTWCNTITKKIDDIIKILNEIKDQAPAVEKRKKINKGCTRNKTTYCSRRSKVQLYSVGERQIEIAETLSTKFMSPTLVVPASHNDGSIKGIDKTKTGRNKLEEGIQVTPLLSSEDISLNYSSASEEDQVFVSPNSEISPDTAGITAYDKNREVFVSTERQATNTILLMVSISGSLKFLCLAVALIYVNAGGFVSAAGWCGLSVTTSVVIQAVGKLVSPRGDIG